MDTLLPVRVCAQARLWAEERYRIKKALAAESEDPLDSPATGRPSISLLVAVVDAVNLTGSFGMSRIEVSTARRGVDWTGPLGRRRQIVRVTERDIERT